MPTPSKFNASTRSAFVEALRFGATQNTAAWTAGISSGTAARWMERAEKAPEGGVWHQFYLDVLRAKGEARLKLTKSAFASAIDNGALAWKMLDKIEPEYRSEPEPRVPAQMVVRLELPGQPREATSEVIALPPAG